MTEGYHLLYDFNVGDKVRWVSSTQGQWSEKVGEIVEVIPPNYGLPLKKYKGKYNLSTVGKGMPRMHESYLVAVPVNGKKAKLYWPRATHLEPCPKS